MNTRLPKKYNSRRIASNDSPNKQKNNGVLHVNDLRPVVSTRREIGVMANNSPQVQRVAKFQDMANQSTRAISTEPIQQKANHTGIPSSLKNGIESISGYSLDDVKVHYNSSQPAQLKANAFAQGTDIHLGPGQEKHLPHEAWHIVQQKQGRVKTTLQMKGNVQINDDKELEHEADKMGDKALRFGKQIQFKAIAPLFIVHKQSIASPIQLFKTHRDDIHYKKKKDVIKAQNDAIKAIDKVYIDESDRGVPDWAYSLPNDTRTEAVRAKLPLFSTLDFLDNCKINFNTENYSYTIELIAPVGAINWESPATWETDIEILLDAVKQRIGNQFRITKRIEYQERDFSNRQYTGAQAYSPNPLFSGVLHYDGVHPPVVASHSQLETVLGLDPSHRRSAQPAAASYSQIPPSKRDQPFLYFVPEENIEQDWTSPPSPSEFERLSAAAAEKDTRRQVRISKHPKISRKAGKRDPNTKMKVAATSLVDNGVPPKKKGDLASHEWCHLVGDGDSGKCAPENLVVGSNQVNTEQLAMETSLRAERNALREENCSILIDAHAIGSEVDTGKGKALVATYIKYTICITPLGKKTPRTVILEHVMNAQRGPITSDEYTTLGGIVRASLQLKIQELKRAGRPQSPKHIIMPGSFPPNISQAPWFKVNFHDQSAVGHPSGPLKRKSDSQPDSLRPPVPHFDEEPDLVGQALNIVERLNPDDYQLFNEAIESTGVDVEHLHERFRFYKDKLPKNLYNALKEELDFG